jgi:hypothetical protein
VGAMKLVDRRAARGMPDRLVEAVCAGQSRVSRPLEYGAGVVVEQPPAEGDFDLMVGDLMELATVMESIALQHI